MKRLVSLLVVLLILTGCGFSQTSVKEPVTFYYPRAAFAYQTENGVIGKEVREASGHVDDLSLLLSLYFSGPTDSGLLSPFPAGTKVIQITETEGTLTLQLTDTAQTLTDAQFSLACACLSLTAIGITGEDSVCITSGNRTLTTTPETLLLFDESILGAMTEKGDGIT